MARTAIAVMALLALGVVPAMGQATEITAADRTLSPYFFVPGGDPAVDRLPLESTSAQVRIAGVIADVTVTQVYRNRGDRPIEAIYVFPASTRAAVYGLRMAVGDRVIEAVIKERGQARADYEQARAQGRTASLLEQQRPNVFQMNVANVLPGDRIEAVLRYTELLVPSDGVYEFVYPAVVGPRYSNRPAAGAPETERWVESPYQHEGEAPAYGFGFSAVLSAGMPISRISCPSHKVDVTWSGRSLARVTLDPGEARAGNRDVVLRYELAGRRIETGLLLYRGGDENFFLLMAQPPARPALEEIPAREFIFVVDVSGSMNGFPLEVSKTLLHDLVGSLRPTDTFNVLLFAGGSTVLSERSLPATEGNIRLALETIDRQQGGGGTELVPALRRALALPCSDGVARTIVVATDGYVSVERETFALIRSHLGDANLFAFGIGTSVNRMLIEGMARAGMGEAFVVAGADGAAAEAERFRRYIAAPVLTDVGVAYEGFDAYDVEPAGIPDVLADRPVVVFGKWRGPLQGRVVVRGVTGSGAFRRSFDVSAVPPSGDNVALRYLWARHRIRSIGDDYALARGDGEAKEITRLGLAYNLLTEFTSFVAVDSRVRGQGGQPETVEQPLPLPQGVSDLAIADAMNKSQALVAAPASMPAMVAGGASGGVVGGVAPVRESNAADRTVVEEAQVSARQDERREGRAPSEGKLEDGRAECLRRQAMRWVFPGTAGRVTVTVHLRVIGGAVTVEKVEAQDAAVGHLVEVATRLRVDRLTACLGRGASLSLRLRLTITADGSVEEVSVLAS
ncbi:MAG: VIT and vWA domain-containing protein [Acidobacteriota bacterium]